MSTFAQLEESVESGQPVELYIVELAGALLQGALATSEKWAYTDSTARNAVWARTTDCAGSYDGGESGGTNNLDLHMGVTFGCGIGAGSGFVRYTRTFGTADGLTASMTYTISMHMSLSRAAGAFDNCGLSVNGGGGLIPSNGLAGVVTTTVTANTAGNIVLTLGHFDLEFGMTGIVVLFGKIAIQGPVPSGAVSTSYYYTSADTAVTFSGNTYLPTVLVRQELTSGGIEVNSADLVFDVPAAHEVAQLFRPGGPERPVTVTMRRLHRANLTDAVKPRVTKVLSAAVQDKVCRITCGARALRLLDREVPRRRYSYGCNHVLYGDLCQSLKALHTLTQVTVTDISADGRTVALAGLTTYLSTSAVDDPFAGGYLAPPLGSPRRVDRSDSVFGTVTLQSPIVQLQVGDVVDVVEGCAHTPEACDVQHSNKEHYGGFIGIPPRDPWDDRGLL